MVGGRYRSHCGATANRLITSKAPAALSVRTDTRPRSSVSTPVVSRTSARSSTSGSRVGGASGTTGSYQTCSAGTDTISRSGYRRAVRDPPKTHPVSRHAVLLIHSTSCTGV